MLRRVSIAFLVLSTAASCHANEEDARHPTEPSDRVDAGAHGGVPPPPPSGGDHGATPGGSQDIGYAREVIARGGVPHASAITVEGLLSEHDIDSVGPPCDALLCLRPALARAPDLESGELAYWLHLGLASGLSDFERPPLDLVVVIDKSQAMSIDMEETNEAVTRLIDQLDPGDRLGVLAFDSEVHTIAEFGPLEEPAATKAAVRDIRASGGFEVTAATEAAYDILARAGDDPDRLRRVVVISCGYPRLAADFDDPYSELVLAGGADRIGMSFFGVLLGYDARLGELLSLAPGGSYGYIRSLEEVEQLFDQDFDFMMTPLGYELSLALEIREGYELERLYGIPGDANADRAQVDVATVFLSRRGGAMAARLRARDGARRDMGRLSFSFLPEVALGDGERIEQDETVTRPGGVGGDEPFFASDGTRKLVALINMATRMQAVGEAYHAGDRDEAAAIASEVLAYLEAEAEALDDQALRQEVLLLEALLDNVRG